MFKRVEGLMLKSPFDFGKPDSRLCRAAHEYLNALGETLLLQGKPGDAQSLLRSALVLIPASALALKDLANTFYQGGDLASAEIYLRRALRMNPLLESGLYLLGVTLANMTHSEEAESYQRTLLAINPAHEGALLLTNHFLAQTGRFDDAEVLIKRAIAAHPNSSAALVELANLRKMTTADSEWMTAAEKLTVTVRPVEEFQLRYAMGKYCDEIKDYDRAFANYRRANQLASTVANNPYIPEDWTRLVDRLVQVNKKPTASQVLAGASTSQRPVFIIGMPRSGSSLVEQIIASHPAVFGAGELLFWATVANTSPSPVFEAEHDEEVLRRLADEYLSHLRSLNLDAVRVVDKMPNNFAYVGLLHSVFPRARFIHTQRNPIDTCLSIYFQNFSADYNYAKDLTDLAHYYRQYHRLMGHWRAILPAGTLLDLAYEELLADQEASSRKMIEFIGLNWDERCLHYQHSKRRVETVSKWQVRQGIYKTSLERWRNYEKFIGPLLALQDLLPDDDASAIIKTHAKKSP